MAHEVFISYATPDKPAADAACNRLEVRGIRCWIAPRDVIPGLTYPAAINTAIKDCQVMVLVFSAKANASKDVLNEVALAFEYRKPVVPLRIEDVRPTGDIQYHLGPVHWLDALTPPLEQHLEKLADSIQRLIGRPGAAPPRPIPPPPPPKPWALYAGLAALALIVVGGLAFLAGGGLSSSGSGFAKAGNFPSAPIQQEDAPPPKAGSEDRPGSARRLPASSTPPASPPAPLAQSSGIIGCWLYNNIINIRIRPDGHITGFLPATWRSEGGDRYSFTWPNVAETVHISPDGKSLSGTNNYGVAISGQRISMSSSGAQSINGAWQWFNGLTVIANEGGSAAAGPLQGHWTSVGAGGYRLDWNFVPLDQLTLSADGATLTGTNNLNGKVAGTRTQCP